MDIYFKEKGITLVSLVVTIVLLMILSGVFIGISSNNNTALNLAQDKKTETEQLLIVEDIKNQLSEDPPKTYDELINFLKNYGIVSNADDQENAILTTNRGGYQVKVSEIWNVDATSPFENVTNETEDNTVTY